MQVAVVWQRRVWQRRTWQRRAVSRCSLRRLRVRRYFERAARLCIKQTIRGIAITMVALLVSGLLPRFTDVRAQELSGKPVRLLVGLSAGGATDVMARLMAQKMAENMRTPVLVE